MSKRAIVIIYDGREAQLGTQKALIDVVKEVRTEGKVYVYTLDEHDMVASIAEHIVHRDNTTTPVIQASSPQDLAAVYIGTRFAEDLNQTIVNKFASNISYAYIIGVVHHSDIELVNAVKILGESEITDITMEIRRRYKITPYVFECIKNVYESTCAGHIA